MKLHLRLLTTAFLIVLMFLSALSASAETVLPEGFVIADDQGISVTETGGYFMNIENILPGDVYTRTVTIRNLEDDTPFHLYLTADEQVYSGPINLLDAVHMDLTLEGELIYSGRIYGDQNAVGTGMIDDALELGLYSYGDSRVMEIKLTVDSTLDNDDYKSASEAKFNWNFVAVKDENPAPPDTGGEETPKDENPEPPFTGGTLGYILYVLCAVMLVAIAILLLLKKKREREQEAIAAK